MFKQDDLIDAILEALRPRFLGPQGAPGPAPAPPQAGPKLPSLAPLKGRRFLTELEIKKALTPGTRRLTIPRDAIVSPLALDWLALQEVELVRE